MIHKFLKKVFAVSMVMCLMQPVAASAKEIADGEQVVGIESNVVAANAQYEYGRLNISSNSYVEFTSPKKIYATNNSSYIILGRANR